MVKFPNEVLKHSYIYWNKKALCVCVCVCVCECECVCLKHLCRSGSDWPEIFNMVCNFRFVWTTKIPLINDLINDLRIPPALSTIATPPEEPITAQPTPTLHLLCYESQTTHLKKQAYFEWRYMWETQQTCIEYLHRTLVCLRELKGRKLALSWPKKSPARPSAFQRAQFWNDAS